MDFTIPDELVELKERTERFVRDEIMPREADKRQTAHGPTAEFRRELVALAAAPGCCRRMSGANGAGSGSTIAARRWCSRRPGIRRWRRSR